MRRLSGHRCSRLTKERANQWPLNILSVTMTIQRCSPKQAFYDVWTVLAAHEPYRDRTQDDERKMELSRTLMVLAANGVTDIAELRRLGFKSLSLPPNH